MPETSLARPYLVDNNPQLDRAALEQRLEDILSEQPAVPASSLSLPSHRPYARPSILRRLLIRAKTSRLVGEWLPRHPGLYRRARAGYHLLKRLAGR